MSNLLCGTMVIRWDVIAIIFAVIFAMGLIAFFVGFFVNGYALRQFSLMNYNKVLKHKKALLYTTKKSKKLLSNTYIILAVSSFEIGNDDDFARYINIVKSINYTASVYWKCVYTFFREQPDNFEMYFTELKQIAEKDNSEANKVYLQNICTLIKKKNGEVILEEEKSQIQNSSSKTIKQYINQ